eukprot:GILI01000470.1.p1 GENE.GILI01000470.1~~GILI01000470.1.p1  ORF type:complete len:203 (-),score=45.42 GILI01000470.1:184-771(-)
MQPEDGAAGGAGAIQPTFFDRVKRSMARILQQYLDASTVYIKSRWVGFFVLLSLYLLRVYLLQGWFIVTYGLGIFLLNLFIGFLSPQVDPETEGPMLPTWEDKEFRPFTRRVPEFKFWYSSIKAVLVAFVMTFFDFFDVPVFWPILLIYFIMLFVLTMKRQIKHMLKYRYIPFSFGKAKYAGKAGEEKVKKPVPK